MPAKIEKQTRILLSKVSFRYGVGPPDVVQSIFPNGSLQAQRAFNPVSARC